MITIHEKIAEHLRSHKGILVCKECGKVEPLGDISHQLQYGWKMCCGYTMEWVTE